MIIPHNGSLSFISGTVSWPICSLISRISDIFRFVSKSFAKRGYLPVFALASALIISPEQKLDFSCGYRMSTMKEKLVCACVCVYLSVCMMPITDETCASGLMIHSPVPLSGYITYQPFDSYRRGVWIRIFNAWVLAKENRVMRLVKPLSSVEVSS